MVLWPLEEQFTKTFKASLHLWGDEYLRIFAFFTQQPHLRLEKTNFLITIYSLHYEISWLKSFRVMLEVNIFFGYKTQFGPKKPRSGAFLAKMNFLRPVSLLKVIIAPIFMVYIMDKVLKVN